MFITTSLINSKAEVLNIVIKAEYVLLPLMLLWYSNACVVPLRQKFPMGL